MGRQIVMTFPFSLGTPGGGPLDCLETARHLRAAGAELVLLPVLTSSLSRFPRAQPHGALAGLEQEAELTRAGVRVVRVQPSRAHYLLDGLAVRHAIETLLKAQRVDAILGWHHEVAFVPRVARASNASFGMIAAGSYARRLKRRNLWKRWVARIRERRFLRRPMRQAEVVFARSAFTGRQVSTVFDVDPSRVRVAYCGVAPGFARLPRARAEQVLRILFYGSWVPEKGVFDAIEALGRVAARHPGDWSFRVAGWGDESGVRRAAHEHGIGSRLVILGRLDHASLQRELEAAQLAVLPSHAESFGLAVAETQAAGVPVVAYAVAAIPELVEDGITGWLVPFPDVEALAQAVLAAIADPPNTFARGLAARDRALRLFSWERTAEVMLEGLEAAIERRMCES